jgi:predicted ribosome quality control (RQC) complex YloA/Tae2 family protein
MKIDIDITKSVEQNAEAYYTASKEAKKKIKGAKRMVEKAKKKLEEGAEEPETQVKIHLDKRRKRWYEKYRWFQTSNGHLVIGGRDADTNEQVVKRHAENNDYVFHTDAPGSPFVVLKRGKNKFSQTDYEEAAVFAATYSQAWKRGLTTSDVFQVKPDQVTKETKAGEYVSKGSFMVYGERKNWSPTLKLSIGLWRDGDDILLMAGPPEAVHEHCTAYADLEQGSKSKGDIARQLMNVLRLDRTDDVLLQLPSGEFNIFNIEKDDLQNI